MDLTWEYITEIIIKKWQIKSLEKAKKIAKAIETIEMECGIHECKITFSECFFCPDIDLNKLIDTPMEECLKEIIEICNN